MKDTATVSTLRPQRCAEASNMRLVTSFQGRDYSFGFNVRASSVSDETEQMRSLKGDEAQILLG